MSPEDFFAAELGRLEASWREERDLRAVAEAFDLCALNSRPMPEWTHQAIRQAISTCFQRNGPEGEPGQGGYRSIAKRLDVHQRRHSIAAWALRLRDSGELAKRRDDNGQPFPLTRDGAFAFAARWLRGKAAQGGPGAIEKSYDQIQSGNRRNITPD